MAIREAVNRQIDQSVVDPNGVVAVAHAQYAAHLEQVTSTVADAREKLRRLESAGEQGEEVADVAEMTAPPAPAATSETRDLAGEAAAAASEAEDALTEIIKRLQVPAACFPGFATAGVQ